MSSPVKQKKIKFKCKRCEFNLVRLVADKDKFCPKCFVEKPYVAPLAPGAKKLDLSASSRMERTAGKCSKGGPHEFRYGKCSKCRRSEGKLATEVGKFVNPGGNAADLCKDGKKHMYQFAKCKGCGKSELAL